MTAVQGTISHRPINLGQRLGLSGSGCDYVQVTRVTADTAGRPPAANSRSSLLNASGASRYNCAAGRDHVAECPQDGTGLDGGAMRRCDWQIG